MTYTRNDVVMSCLHVDIKSDLIDKLVTFPIRSVVNIKRGLGYSSKDCQLHLSAQELDLVSEIGS